MSLSRALFTTAALGAALLAPSAANAAEGFSGVTTDDDVVRFHSDSLPGLTSRPVAVTGLAADERIVGLDRAPWASCWRLRRPADDTTKPTATLGGRILKRHVARGSWYFRGLNVKVDQGGQALVELLMGGKTIGLGLASRDIGGMLSPQIAPRKGYEAALAKAAAQHRRVVARVRVYDWAGNGRVYKRSLRLS
jgi:hypothetical protein